MAAFTVLIPARMASTRLPNKPLADIAGVPMVVRVAQRAMLSQARRVVVAADDGLIVRACEQHGVHAVLTDQNHPSGSDRLAQACDILGLDDAQTVVNVQGDEPLIEVELINAVASLLDQHPQASMSTAAHTITDPHDITNPNVVKVVCDRQGLALYFSRATIPFVRDPAPQPGHAPLRHIGIYGYRAGFLRRFPSLEQAPMEQLECLEQLRALWHGYRIAVHTSPHAPGPGVDTEQDLEKVRHLWRESGS